MGATLMAGVVGLSGFGGAIAVPVGVLAYGILLAAGGVGMLFRRAWGWWLAIGPVVAGLVLLVVLLVTVGGDDPVLVFGVVIWTITLAALVACRPVRPPRGG